MIELIELGKILGNIIYYEQYKIMTYNKMYELVARKYLIGSSQNERGQCVL